VPEGLRAVEDGVARARLRSYLDCLQHWSPRINLTAARNDDEAFDTLIRPILGAEGLLSNPVIDVGSGNGSPGLILAALRGDIHFTLLEPRAKRWAFLRDAVREMKVENVVVSRLRSDEYRGEPASTVTMRAVGLDPEKLRPLIAERGVLLVFGGPELPGTETLQLPSGGRVQRRCFT
jgi:16S rRNA (guanine527-N7)-methyltransferase